MISKEKKESRARGSIVAVMVLMSLTTLASVACALFLLYTKFNEKPEPETPVASESPEIRYTQEEMEKILEAAIAETVEIARAEGQATFSDYLLSSMSNDKGYLNTLRKVYPDFIIFNDTEGLNFIPVMHSLKKNELDMGEFSVAQNGVMEHYLEGELTSHKGIDVSKFQGDIDWNAVAADGVEYAFIRCGFRGWGEAGSMNADDNFGKNVDNARNAGIHAGAYFYSTAITQEEIDEEVAFVLDALEGHAVDYPVVIDTERSDSGTGRADNLSKEVRTDLVISFCEQIKEAGYTPMIYANTTWYAKKLDMARLEQYDKWFASFTTNFYFPYEIAVWQYSNKGRVSGISGDVDLNMSFKEW